MTPDFRFHVASLAAVFLALGIGMLAGTALVGTTVVDRQTAAVNRLTKETVELRKEIQEQQQTEKTLQAAVPLLVKNVLVRERVLVVQTGPSREAADQAQKALELAGARVERETLTDLGAERLLALPNLPQFVVLAGGESDDTIQSNDLPLLKSLHEAGIRTVAVELFEAPTSLVSTWSRQADATVDCINRATGWLALVVAIAGEDGTFGLKPGATTIPLEALNRPSPTVPPTPEP